MKYVATADGTCLALDECFLVEVPDGLNVPDEVDVELLMRGSEDTPEGVTVKRLSPMLPRAPSTRVFHRHVFELVVLTEEPLGGVEHGDALAALVHLITEGDCSGELREVSHEELDGGAMAKALMAQRSDPEFFQLTEDGCDLDDT